MSVPRSSECPSVCTQPTQETQRSESRARLFHSGIGEAEVSRPAGAAVPRHLPLTDDRIVVLAEVSGETLREVGVERKPFEHPDSGLSEILCKCVI